MRDAHSIDELGSKLLRHGLPARYVRRVVRELSEHQQDLLAEAKERGLAQGEAESCVNQRLGDLSQLSDQIARSVRHSSWCGRHPILTFCVLPPLAFLVGFGAVLWLGSLVAGLAGWWKPKSTLSAEEWSMVSTGVQLLCWLLFTSIPFWFCWIARRTYCGHKWGLATCVIFSLHGWLHVLKFVAPTNGKSGSLTWSYTLSLDSQTNLLAVLVPWGVFALFLALCHHEDVREGGEASKP